MTTSKSIGDMGGPFQDATVVENPQTDMGSDDANLVFEATAQMTHTAKKVVLRFSSSNTAAPTTVPPTHKSQWGDGAGQLPTVNKTATGRYDVVYAATFPSITEPNTNNIETVNFFSAMVQAWSVTETDTVHARLLGISSNTISILVQSPEGTNADLGNMSGNPIKIEAWIT